MNTKMKCGHTQELDKFSLFLLSVDQKSGTCSVDCLPCREGKKEIEDPDFGRDDLGFSDTGHRRA